MDQGQANGRETEEHYQPRPWGPLWDLLSILQLWFEHVRWTTKNVCSTKVLVGKARLRPDLVGADPCAQGWQAVEDPNCIVGNCEWLQAN